MYEQNDVQPYKHTKQSQNTSSELKKQWTTNEKTRI